MRSLLLIAHNVRSAHNVGSLLRTADGLGVQTVFLTGYTPYPVEANDKRLPHIAEKVERQIHKTALGAEKTVGWKHEEDIFGLIDKLKRDGFKIAALEQADGSVKLPSFTPTDSIALIVGREVEGIETDIVKQADIILEIPMLGQKESLNVASAAAIALYHLRFKA